MNKQQLFKFLPFVFTALTAASIIGVYYTHQLPIYETRTTTLATHRHTGTYNYAARLKPNFFYNKTTLTPGEGTLYSAIVDQINISFDYTFNCTPNPSDTTINPMITIELESPERWTRTLSEAEVQELIQLNGSLNFSLEINQTKIQMLVTHIDEETGLRSTSYNLNIKPEIHIKTEVAANQIDEVFTPELTVAFITGGEKGNYISIENLQQTKSGAIIKESQVYLKGVEGQRRDLYAATAITSLFLAMSIFLYFKEKPEIPPSKPIEKIISPYKELITETSEKPPETEKTIIMNTFEDIAKIAEILAKPILHTTEDEKHTFYIIEDNTKYQYITKKTPTTEPPDKREKKKQAN